jgi:hypothetical protein
LFKVKKKTNVKFARVLIMNILGLYFSGINVAITLSLLKVFFSNLKYLSSNFIDCCFNLEILDFLHQYKPE